MKATAVPVPASLLCSPELTLPIKLIWIFLRLSAPDSPNCGQICRQTGLSRPTVVRGLARLAAEGWHFPGEPGVPFPVKPGGPTLSIPADLVTDTRIGGRARLLYGLLQLTPEFSGSAGRFRFASLGALMQTSALTAKRTVRELARAGWIETSQANQRAPVLFELLDPSSSLITRVRRYIQEAPYRGEAIMRAYLSLLVDSDDFRDNATPAFLVNPLTKERLQFDRYYPPSVGCEFNGPQHFQPTERFSVEKVDKQRARDLMKIGLCVSEGVHLVVVRAADLTLAGMRAKVEGLLPMRDLSRYGPLIRYVETASRRYREEARLWES